MRGSAGSRLKTRFGTYPYRLLEGPLASHLARVSPGPDDLVFPGAYQDYGAVRRAWDGTCKAAAIAGATPHDARHTFAVHAAMAGVPIVRLQNC
jgi:integrase